MLLNQEIVSLRVDLPCDPEDIQSLRASFSKSGSHIMKAGSKSNDNDDSVGAVGIGQFQQEGYFEGPLKTHSLVDNSNDDAEIGQDEKSIILEKVSQSKHLVTGNANVKLKSGPKSRGQNTSQEPSKNYGHNIEKEILQPELEAQDDGPFGFEGSDLVFDSQSASRLQ